MHTSRNVRANGAGVHTLMLTFELMLAGLIIIGGIAFPQQLWPRGEAEWLQHFIFAIVLYLVVRATMLQDYAKRWGMKMKALHPHERYDHFDYIVVVAYTIFLFLIVVATLSATVGNLIVNLIFLGLAVLLTCVFNTRGRQVPPSTA